MHKLSAGSPRIWNLKENFVEIQNNSEDSDYSDKSSESYASDIPCESEDESSDEKTLIFSMGHGLM